ncbi:hypothetical protein Scani_78850 [Streptomyces caniferus]|uniref:Uncharacterized protein n=1 Tax=Streptomyces caniferus TaxID=285557 RepID=A0A640SK38_9ACTN|nr:hypothetical protein [Streptomyces caniferus]GFE11617.1 hypothetical protein Scani_78850 [Streptomyces caniferus]
MPLYAREFFTELGIPFANSTVVGNTYYATPIPGDPRRLRIEFSPTIRAFTYGGLRVQVIHPHTGEVDSTVLTFSDHETFLLRDRIESERPGYSQHGTFDKYHRAGEMPWQGAEFDGLRRAIEQYSQVWFPGAWATATPSRSPGRTVHQAPTPQASPSAGRTR